MPASPAVTLFGDYTLAAPSPLSPGRQPSPVQQSTINVVFPTSATGSSAASTDNLTPLPGRVSRRTSDESVYDPEMEEIHLGVDDDHKEAAALEEQYELEARRIEDELDDKPLEPEPDFNKSTARPRRGTGYNSYEGCMEGGLGHEAKADTYTQGTEKAYHHLNRANELFGLALKLKPTSAKAMLCRANVLIKLATNYQPPRTATVSLREARSLLRDLVGAAPRSTSAREALARACSLLSSTLYDTDDLADDARRMWDGEPGQLAREALENLEDVAADRMDKMRAMKAEEASAQAPAMAETFLALSEAAVIVSQLATDLAAVDLHVELAEQALDQASNMATVAAAARIKSSTSSANLITRVQLASGRSSLERIRHTFLLGRDLDEDDFRSLTADMSVLATEARERAAKLRGSKGQAASGLAHEAVRQLGEAKLLYASLLRLVWRQRKPKRAAERRASAMSTASASASDTDAGAATLTPASRRVSLAPPRKPSRQNSYEASTIVEEEEGEEGEDEDEGAKGRNDSLHVERAYDQRGPINRSSSASSSSQLPARLGGGSISTASSFSGVPSTGRRGSWLPTSGDALAGRQRRMSSMSQPLVGPDGISAWNRKASVIRLVEDEQREGLVPSTQLAASAYQLLEGAIKQFKLALALLNSAALAPAPLARAKADVLAAIAYCAMFRASLAPRVPAAAEKRTALLVTAEVYATWSAREVGWSFLVEGTKEAALADRRTNSWRADEAGKRAVMLLVRIWWHRAVTTPTHEVDTKAAAKDAVEVVVRRMKDREGVKDGDVARFRAYLGRIEGDMDAAEQLFWRSVSRILRGGNGFVMG
ncbi:hypothetical protein Q5752_004199 [Cryptotrichosporon argae]